MRFLNESKITCVCRRLVVIVNVDTDDWQATGNSERPVTGLGTRAGRQNSGHLFIFLAFSAEICSRSRVDRHRVVQIDTDIYLQ